ncbi:MAG: SDR family oxidoreductase [Deltaproteobacteria bacterium]|nr:SDR family oxidoreductase [Deltaproteobacteria bacterium]
MSFAGRVYLVTGSTQGVGEAIARRLLDGQAAGVVLTGRDVERGQALERALGAKAYFVPGFLEREGDCRALVAKGHARFGRIDGLVNAAGLTDRGTLDDTRVELWDRLFAVNVRAPFILSQEVVRRLKAEKRPGAIVNIITMSSHGGQPFLVAYSSSKGALATLTKNLANGLRFDRIRVNGINLGWTDTPGEHAIQKKDGNPPDWLERAEPKQPFGRLIKAKDAAALAAFLLSDEAEMMTGALIDLDQNVIGAYS